MSGPDEDASFLAEALPTFINEAQEQTELLEQLLLQLESAPGDAALLDALFRCAHTIKGSGGMFGLDRLVAFTHHVETLLDRLRSGDVGLTPELSTLLLQSNDRIRQLVGAALDPGSETDDGEAASAALVERLKLASGDDGASGHEAPTVGGPGPMAPAASLWHVVVQFGRDTFRNGMDPLAILNFVRGMGSIPRVVCDTAAVPAAEGFDPEDCHLAFAFALETAATREEIESAFSFVRDECSLSVLGPTATHEDVAAVIAATPQNPRLEQMLRDIGALAQPPAGGPRAAAVPAAAPRKPAARADAGHGPVAADDSRFIRVQADRLDEVINLLGELVIAGAGASLLARQSRQRGLMEANQQTSRLIERIRNSTLQLRMVPMGETFARFRRVVRDTASELGKDVALEIIGGDTELDKSMVERIADPLMHLVRNALDHGLETPAQRLAAGKPPQGRLTLSACHDSGGILIRIRDDGRGVQQDKVLQRAWERGLVEHGVVPPEAEILKLIFEAGFSTAEKVTNLSGRGVGMDVVRRNIEALRGSVTIGSVAGQGSCIEIRLPLTLAIIDGFLVGVGASKFIFPLESVVEVIESRATAVAVDARGRSRVELRGRVLPVVDLRTLYALGSRPPVRSSVVVVRSGSSSFGVMVDVLLGQHQTVIKPLGRLFESLRGVAGTSILGTGEVALILDASSLGQLAARPPAAHSAAHSASRHHGDDTRIAATPSPEGQPS